MKSSDLNPYPRLYNTASSGQDLNTLVTAGMYSINASAVNGPPGVPADWSQVLVVRGAGDTIWQMFSNHISLETWIRSGNPPQTGGSGSWNPWIRLIDSRTPLVNSFNGRTGAVGLTGTDVGNALGFWPRDSTDALVESFNGRVGDVGLGSADVTNALGFTPVSLTQVRQNAVGLYAAGSNADLNNITTSGIYRLDATPINGPAWATSEVSQLLVFRGGGDTVVQMIVDWATGSFSFRQGNPPSIGGSGDWKPWQHVVTSANQTMQLANPWYIKIPGGLILQGGNIGPVGSAGGQGPYYFGTTFPNACISLVVSGDSSNQVAVTGGSITTSSFKFDVSSGSTVYVHWIAAGY